MTISPFLYIVVKEAKKKTNHQSYRKWLNVHFMRAMVCCKPTHTCTNEFLSDIRHFSVNYKQFAVRGRIWIDRSAEIGLFIYLLFANRLMQFSLFPFHYLIRIKFWYDIYWKSHISQACFSFLGRKICYLSHWTPWFIEFLHQN